MRNRLDLLQGTEVSEDFWSHCLFRELGFLEGLESPESIIARFIEEETAEREAAARKEGTLPLMQPSTTIRPKIVKCLDGYISLITRIGGYVQKRAGAEFAPEELELLEARTSFDFSTWQVRILFLIDADRDSESAFYRFLNEVEKAVLLEERFVAELLHFNRRGRGNIPRSISSEYPFTIKPGVTS